MVLKELQYLNVFSEAKATRFPARKPYNHQIDIKPGFKPKRHKLYSLTPKEDALLKTFVDKNLSKGYICSSKSKWLLYSFLLQRKTERNALVRTTDISTNGLLSPLKDGQSNQ